MKRRKERLGTSSMLNHDNLFLALVKSDARAIVPVLLLQRKCTKIKMLETKVRWS
jgi:hypothetical protein